MKCSMLNRYGGLAMKGLCFQRIIVLSLLILVCAAWPARTLGGGCAVSDGSKWPSEDGCLLAFVYNQTGEHRLVVVDEGKRRRYEAPLKESKQAPFWEGGRVYVVGGSGKVQGFSVVSDQLTAEKEETLCEGVVFAAEYSRSQHRLYVIRTAFDNQQKISHELLAIDFPARKTFWTSKLDDPGVVTIMGRYVCVAGLKLVRVFDSDTGRKLGGIEAPKQAPGSASMRRRGRLATS